MDRRKFIGIIGASAPVIAATGKVKDFKVPDPVADACLDEDPVLESMCDAIYSLYGDAPAQEFREKVGKIRWDKEDVFIRQCAFVKNPKLSKNTYNPKIVGQA